MEVLIALVVGAAIGAGLMYVYHPKVVTTVADAQAKLDELKSKL